MMVRGWAFALRLGPPGAELLALGRLGDPKYTVAPALV